MWSSYQSISSRRCEAIGRPGRQGPGGRRAFLDDLLGARRQGRADLGREVQEVLVTGEPLQGRLHQAAGAADIAALVGQLGLQELKLWAAERGVVGQPSGARSIRASTLASEVSFWLTRPQPLRVQPWRDSQRMSWGAARRAKPANPCWACSLAHSSATASDATNPAASMGSSEWK